MAGLGVISDMDRVVYRGRQAIPGAQELVDRLRASDTPFVFLTNNSEQTPLDLVRKLAGLGVHGLTMDNFITSAMATARFVATQKPKGAHSSSAAGGCPPSSTGSGTH